MRRRWGTGRSFGRARCVHPAAMAHPCRAASGATTGLRGAAHRRSAVQAPPAATVDWPTHPKGSKRRPVPPAPARPTSRTRANQCRSAPAQTRPAATTQPRDQYRRLRPPCCGPCGRVGVVRRVVRVEAGDFAHRPASSSLKRGRRSGVGQEVTAKGTPHQGFGDCPRTVLNLLDVIDPSLVEETLPVGGRSPSHTT